MGRTRRLLLVMGVCAVTVLALGATALAGEGYMGTDTPGIHEPGTGTTEPLMQRGDGPPEGAPEYHQYCDTGGQWYEEYANNMYQHRFMNGYANGEFGGYDQINRAQFAVIMARMLGFGPGEPAPFSDTAGHWAEGEIGAMVRAGIIAGHADGTFGPYEPITRGQMAAMMDRALEHLGVRLTQQERDQLRTQLREHLTDCTGHWAEYQIAHMYRLGITTGDEAGHFRPDEHTNRAQAAAMLWRFYEGHLQ